MKKLIIIIAIVIQGIAATAQEVSVLDSTIIQDTKLLIAKERIQEMFNALEKFASEEKIQNDSIAFKQPTQRFIRAVEKDFNRYLESFIRVDTIKIDTTELTERIGKLQKWQQKVLNDDEIKEATNLSAWERKNDELIKLLKYKKQIK